MIKRQHDQKSEVRTNPKGGVGDVLFTHILTEEAAEKVNLFSIVTLQPGQSFGQHAHYEDAEAIFVLEGHPSVLDGGQTHILNPGDASYCTGGAEHRLFNESDGPAKVLAIVMR